MVALLLLESEASVAMENFSKRISLQGLVLLDASVQGKLMLHS